MRSRVTRMGVGLVGLILVLAVTGSLLAAAGLGGEATAWIVLLVALVWLVLMTSWTLRAPPARSEEASARYWAALRHARFGSQDEVDDKAKQSR